MDELLPPIGLAWRFVVFSICLFECQRWVLAGERGLLEEQDNFGCIPSWTMNAGLFLWFGVPIWTLMQIGWMAALGLVIVERLLSVAFAFVTGRVCPDNRHIWMLGTAGTWAFGAVLVEGLLRATSGK